MSTLSVLEDAILWQGGELPDELCPLYLVAKGRELGGDAAAVAEVALREHREAWFGGYDPEAIWKQLRKGHRHLRRVEVASAVRWHVQSEQQVAEAWGADALVVVPNEVVARQAIPTGQRYWGHLRTLAAPASSPSSTFRIQSAPGSCRWVGDTSEGRDMSWPMKSVIHQPFGPARGPIVGWHRAMPAGAIVRPLTGPQRSRKARDAARASRQAEAEMVVGVGR